jgi:hypothetical protein
MSHFSCNKDTSGSAPCAWAGSFVWRQHGLGTSLPDPLTLLGLTLRLIGENVDDDSPHSSDEE